MNIRDQITSEIILSGNENPKKCKCRGGGWVLSNYDTWETCGIHFNDQNHPEDREEPIYCEIRKDWFLPEINYPEIKGGE